ncbi:threonine synthase [Mycoplasmatota bacterium]|nr:threonine synthase [Mycoplasmatota bacterium]
MKYQSTRGEEVNVSSSEAIIKGIANDGGLYVPTKFPVIDLPLDELTEMSYKELAFYIMKKYFTDFDDKELKECINNAYDGKFESIDIAPSVKKQGVYFLELYHGPTLAFKDMALSILPYLLKTASKKLNITKEIIILTATSGDTGKAALEGFSNVEGVKVIVFYPKNGVSDIQKRQMITQNGLNTFVVGIEGNFDDAQTGVKELLNSKAFNKKLDENNYIFSSANSINIGRLIPQVVYYFYTYLKLLKNGSLKKDEKINIVVPTGNFGNILAAFYAKKMGLPVNKLSCASNENNILYDFINTGIYDTRRTFKMTSSPSMDILISSNLERLLYEFSNHDSKLIISLMKKMKEEGIYELPKKHQKGLKDFYTGYACEDEVCKTIKEVYDEAKYLIDPHTSVGYSVYKKYKEDTKDNTKTIIVSTASPFKFTRSVYQALNGSDDNLNDFDLINKLADYTRLEVPNAIKDIENREILHKCTCNKDEMMMIVKKILSI